MNLIFKQWLHCKQHCLRLALCSRHADHSWPGILLLVHITWQSTACVSGRARKESNPWVSIGCMSVRLPWPAAQPPHSLSALCLPEDLSRILPHCLPHVGRTYVQAIHPASHSPAGNMDSKGDMMRAARYQDVGIGEVTTAYHMLLLHVGVMAPGWNGTMPRAAQQRVCAAQRGRKTFIHGSSKGLVAMATQAIQNV